MLQETSDPKYIAVEGVIGVGKTTFARMLADRNKKRYAFSCQLYFLISRFQQQQQLMERDLFAQRIVADYLFAKDGIFASINLSDRELLLYNKIAPVLSKDIPRPDLAIYLQASTGVLMQRVKKRNFSFERPIDTDYLDMLNRAYDYFFFNYTDTPLLVVKTDDIDFVNNPEHFDDLIEQIAKPITGKKYYIPAGNLTRE
jgi:deoxyadenosine/deoxycytidine kinase